jgi:predicted MFS family arabinose efflux permease
VPISLLAIAAAVRYLPRDRPQPCDRLDVPGFLLLASGMVALVFGLAEVAEASRPADAAHLVPLVAGALLVAAFVLHARGAANPLIDVRLFRQRSFSAGVASSFCLAMALFGMLFVVPLYYQRARGLSPLDAGLLLAPQGIGAGLAIPVAGWLTDRIGPGRVVIAGVLLVVAGTLPFGLSDGDMPYPVLVAALVVRGLGLGASTIPAQAGAYAALKEEAVARAAAVINVSKRLGGSVGVALLAVVLERAGPDTAGFSHAFWWLAGFAVLALASAVFLPRRPAVDRDR